MSIIDEFGKLYRRSGRAAVVCRYLAFNDPHLRRIFRLPMVHVRVRQGKVSFRTNALVDSGATATFLPIELANTLGFGLKPEGIEQTDQEKKDNPKHDAVGASGVFKTYHVRLDSIEVLKGLGSFCELSNLNIIVPASEGSIPHAVLGRDGIFRRHHITFKELEEHVVFRRNR